MAEYSIAVAFLFFFIHMVAGQCGRELIFDNCTAKDNFLRTAAGRPIGDRRNLLTVGPRGPALMQDFLFMEEMAHFDMERIPDRVVHARGNGAFGYFEVTDNITRFSKAKVFSQVGKRTPTAVRFSICSPELGSPDSVRDFRGFAVKFYTEDGNWDVVTIHMPVSPVRDPLLFQSIARTLKKSPVSNIKDENRFWDFVSLRPENTAALLFHFSDRMIPLNYRHMDGYGVNTFKLVNASGEQFYCRYTISTNQGIKNLLPEKAQELSGSDPDNFIKDLFNSIKEENYPSWTFNIQVMTMDQFESVPFNPLDPTREWPISDFPLIQVGKLVLNRNPKNNFAEIEQLAFNPASLVPGIELSPDKLLQGRVIAYSDAQRYRLGTNYQQIPVNRPVVFPPKNYERDGLASATANGGSSPDYFPNSYGGPVADPTFLEKPYEACGVVARYDSSGEDNYSQAKIYYERMDEGEKQRLARNIATSLINAEDFIQERQLGNFKQVQPELELRILTALSAIKGT